MSSYNALIDKIFASTQETQIEQLTREVISELTMSHKDIANMETRDIVQSKLYSLFQKAFQSCPLFFFPLKEIASLLYLKESPMLSILHQFIPSLLGCLYNPKQSLTNVDKLIEVIKNNEIVGYRHALKERSQHKSSAFVKELYLMHFGGKYEEESEQEEKGEKRQANRQQTKLVLLFVVHKSAQELYPFALKQYLQVIFLGCGGQKSTYDASSSYYFLEKKNLFNPFASPLSEEEVELMLLTLYELSVVRPKEKYELLAAVNMIYKKTANESMFKHAGIAQAIVHLLEDQYQDIFS